MVKKVKYETLGQLIDELVEIRETINEENIPIELFDYRYEEYYSIDSIEYDEHSKTIKIK